MALMSCTPPPQSYDHRPSRGYIAGTKRVGFLPTRQALLTPSGEAERGGEAERKRQEVTPNCRPGGQSVTLHTSDACLFLRSTRQFDGIIFAFISLNGHVLIICSLLRTCLLSVPGPPSCRFGTCLLFAPTHHLFPITYLPPVRPRPSLLPLRDLPAVPPHVTVESRNETCFRKSTRRRCPRTFPARRS